MKFHRKMGKLKCKLGLALTTCTALLLQAQAENKESCSSEDLFWDESQDACRTCSRCGVGMQSTAANCGDGEGSQGVCEVCPTEYYQDQQHTKEQCQRCVQCDPEAGLQLGPCTAEHNRLCGCQLGFGVNPMLANTCIKCDIWPGDPLEGCDRTSTKPTTTLVTSSSKHTPTRQKDIQTAYTGLQQGGKQSLSDAAIISISVVCAVVFMMMIIVGAALALYYYLRKGRQTPPVRINNSDSTEQIELDNNRNRSLSSKAPVIDVQTPFLATSTPVPPHVTLPAEEAPLMNAQQGGDERQPNNSMHQIKTNGSAPATRLAPTLQLLSLERWTPQGTPRGTPRSTPKHSPVLNRSLSAPCGDRSSYSDNSFTPPRSDIVEENEENPQSLALSEKTRKGAMQCQAQVKQQKMQEDKQKARSIAAHHSLSEFIQDFNVTKDLCRMLEINEDSIKSDWRDLAADWGYTHSTIQSMKDVAKRGTNSGLALLFEQENAEHFGVRNLEHLLDGLEKIKRNDSVQYLAQYLIRKSDETTL